MIFLSSDTLWSWNPDKKSRASAWSSQPHPPMNNFHRRTLGNGVPLSRRLSRNVLSMISRLQFAGKRTSKVGEDSSAIRNPQRSSGQIPCPEISLEKIAGQ